MASGEEIGAAVISVTADASGLTAGIAQATQSVKQFAQTANQAGRQAGESLAAGSTRATAEAIKLAREQDRLTAQIERYAQSVGRTRGEVLEARAQALGLSSALQTQLGSIKATESALKQQTSTLNQYGLTAKGQAAALRQVPAQLTDIVVSLQGGQAPLTVLLQQGGQLKDVFGGIVPAAKALGGAVLGLLNPFTVIAGAVALLTFGYVKGQAESEKYNASLITTGNIAGRTAGQLADAAARIDGVIGTQAQAAESLAALASTGLVSGSDLEAFATTSIRIQKTLGTSVADTAKQFADLGKDPVNAVRRLNESMNFLTLETFRQITALVEQGRETEAGEVAQRAFAQAMDQRTARLQDNFGVIERGWKSVAGFAAEAWDEFLGIGRADTLQERITSSLSEVDRLRNRSGAGTTFGGASAARNAAAIVNEEANLANLREISKLASSAAAAEGERARNTKAQIEAQTRVNELEKQTLSNSQKRSKEIDKLRKDAALIGLSTEKINALEKSINEKYKDPARRAAPAVQDNEATRYLLRLKEINAALTAQTQTESKLTEAEKERARFIQQIADLKEKKILTADQKSLLASEKVILKQLDLNATVSKEVEAREEAAKAIKRQEEALGRFRDASEALSLTVSSAVEGRAEGRTSALSGVGRGDRAREELEAQRQLNREYEKYETQLAKSAARNGVALDSPEFLKGQQALRDARDQELAAQSDYFDRLRELQGNYLVGATRALENYYEASRNVAEQVGEVFTNAFNGAEDALTKFINTGKLDLKSLGDSIQEDITRGLVRTQITGPAAKLLQGEIGSGSGIGGVLGSVLGGIFGSTGAEGNQSAGGAAAGAGLAAVATGSSVATAALSALAAAAYSAITGLGGQSVVSGASGGGGFLSTAFNFVSGLFGRASGGPVGAGNAYQVNENGPELLTVGNKQVLMMGSQSGQVTPMSNQGRGGNNITVYVTQPPGSTRETGMQFGEQAARQINRANLRNG